MKKFFTLIAVALISAAAFADSYTLTFKSNGDGDASTQITAATAVTDIIAEGADYVSSFAGANGAGTKGYLAKEGYGLKLGSSSAAGNLVFKLSAKGAQKITSIVVSAAAYKSTETPYATVNGKAISITGSDFADYTVELDGTKLDSIYLSGSQAGRYYVKSITVNYTADSFDATKCHSPKYSAGVPFEYVLGPDMLDETMTKDGAAKKGIATRYQWIEYINPTSALDNGQAEVQTSNRWTNYNPKYADYNYGTGANWIQIKGEDNQTVNSPVLSASYGKYIQFFVKDTKKVSILGIGSASGSAADGNCIHVVAKTAEGEAIEAASKAGGIYGKGTASDTLNITLDPAKSYLITVKGDETAKKDIMLGGIQLFGTDTIAGPAVHAANPTYDYKEVVFGPQMTKAIVAAADGKTYYIAGQDWITYNNPTSTLAEGTEVQTSNRWTNIDPAGQTTGFIQIKINGSDKCPVITQQYAKTITFSVKGTSKFTVYGTGSSSNKENDLNALYVNAQPYNSDKVVTANSTPGKIYGKGTSSDSVSVVLDPTERYAITIKTGEIKSTEAGGTGKGPDAMITGINLWTVAGEAQAAEGNGTLNKVIADAVNGKKYGDNVTIELGECGSYTSVGNTTSYTLKGAAKAGAANVIINGNGAAIVADTLGQIVTKGYLVIDNVNFDASASKVAPIALAPKADMEAADTTNLYTYVDSTATYKYEGANQKVFEAQLISLMNSTYKTGKALVFGNTAPWALRKLNIDNCIVERTTKTGDPIINFYGGANGMQTLNISNSTFYSDSTSTDFYFLRLTNASSASATKVWGTGATGNWVFTSNTIVNAPSNKDFGNNTNGMQGYTLTMKKNIFANTSLIQKFVRNIKVDFTAADNAICGGTRAVDATDTTKYATFDPGMGIFVEGQDAQFAPAEGSYAYDKLMGDPRHFTDAMKEKAVGLAKEELEVLIGQADDLLDEQDVWRTGLAEYKALAAENAKAKVVNEDPEADYLKVTEEIDLLKAAIEAYKARIATAIVTVNADANVTRSNVVYNLAGQRVSANTKGIVIVNGKKYLNK